MHKAKNIYFLLIKEKKKKNEVVQRRVPSPSICVLKLISWVCSHPRIRILDKNAQICQIQDGGSKTEDAKVKIGSS